jgi:hypothetical protein
MEPTYINAKQAMKILDLPSTTFYREVEAGNIPHILAKGRKRGMLFPKEAIELHARRQKKQKRKPVHHAFTRATNADIWLAIENARRIYGEEDIIPYEKVLEWREINDEMTMSIKEDGQFVGCTTIMPLDERVIQDLIYDRIREKNIPNWAIKKWTDPKLSLYIASIAVESSDDLELDKERGMFLLRHTIKWGITLSHQYDIKNWYAVGTTDTGQKILEELGFQEIVSLNNGKRKGYTLRNLLKSKIIQQFIDEMEHKDLLLSDQRTKFMIATPDDILDEYNLATAIFGNATHNLQTRHAWLEKNPESDFIVRDHEQLVGFLNLLPVKHETIMKFIRGEIRGWEIPAEDILPYTPNSKVECIVMGMATTPEAEPNKRTQYGRRLINGVARFLRELAEKNIVITKLYATSSTPTGIAILRNTGFQEIGQIGKRIAFEFDTMTSSTPLAIKYREALNKED